MAKATTIVNKKPRGRPLKGVAALGTMVGVRFDGEMLAAIDAFADGRNRSDAVRELVRLGLGTNPSGKRRR